MERRKKGRKGQKEGGQKEKYCVQKTEKRKIVCYRGGKLTGTSSKMQLLPGCWRGLPIYSIDQGVCMFVWRWAYEK